MLTVCKAVSMRRKVAFYSAAEFQVLINTSDVRARVFELMIPMFFVFFFIQVLTYSYMK